MKKSAWFLASLFLMAAAVVVMPTIVRSADSELTLKECYRLALVRSEAIGIQEELIKETKGLMLQSLSTALPKVAFAYSEKWQDLAPNDKLGGASSEGKFTFTQPLFTGFREFAAVGASKHIGKQRAAELKRARQLLFTDVSDAFYLYLSYQDDLAIQQDIQKTLSDRVAELKKREILGKSRSSEVASAEANLLRTEANIEAARGQMEVAGQLLEFLIGQPIGILAAEPFPGEVEDLGALASKADSRPDVAAARESWASYKKNITAARASFLPTVALTGNAYTKRPDLNEHNDWDATLSVNVPLFNGLNDVGQLAQARAQANEAQLRLSQLKRQALMQIKNAFTAYQSSRKRFLALEKAVEASDKNYHLQAEDFQKNLVNNLDVLQALQDLQGVRRDDAASKAAVGRAYWNLKVATGDIDP